jgi:hypothetical protein
MIVVLVSWHSTDVRSNYFLDPVAVAFFALAAEAEAEVVIAAIGVLDACVPGDASKCLSSIEI